MRICYSEDELFPGQFSLYNANVDRQIAGKKGQAVLRELEAALLAMPEKRLVGHHLACDGAVCAVGVLLVLKRQRAGMTYEQAIADLNATYADEDIVDGAYYTNEIASSEGVAPDLVAWKLVELNDVVWEDCTPEDRYRRMLSWVRIQLGHDEDREGLYV